MIITKEIEIDMGHRVMNHKSKCRSCHGHRYKIEVGVNDKLVTIIGSSDEGMVMDFGDLKQIMMREIDAEYDHGFIISRDDKLLIEKFGVELFNSWKVNHKWLNINDIETKLIVVDFIPTAENLAKHWFIILKEQLEKINIRIHHVKIWETPTSTALYTIDNFLEDI